MSIKIKTKPEILLRSRLEVLHGVVRELTEGFLGDLRAHGDILETLQKGIVERQILACITFYYLNSDEELEGKIKVEIDWRQHQVFATTEAGKQFPIDRSKSIRDQISGIYSVILQHTDELKKALGVVEVRVHYRYRPEIERDPKKDAEAIAFLGHVKSVAPQKVSSRELSGDSLVKLEYCSRNLRELRISIEHKRPS
ncbi:hypothetical protein AMR42_10520 [Limnothrix sp. PR1529]|uniref:hypothetical protein n=1 Tax=Limnothrix sp. PR1529 TaxID=1704291 RepID=UPI00081D5015|nr:hypothetical protein [Limnothrix sp. PR1529]OCQ91031.1 hypothetical protein BCR12_13305 [Limnothrix sp. P13C2]PIB10632.1 hypothetical protein AMR42_10520 [Limnothrix sp. PR1529]